MEEKQRNKVGYYSVIPSKILYNKELKANEKLLYAMITSLAYKEGYCFATNNYFAEELGVHPKTVSSWISDLRDKNYIIIFRFFPDMGARYIGMRVGKNGK